MSFPGFLNEFSNSPISIAFPSYLGLSVGPTPPEQPSPVQLYWSFQQPYQPNVFSQVIHVTENSSVSNSIVLPDATATTGGQSCLIYNSSTTDINLLAFGGLITVSGTPILAGGLYDIILTSNVDQSGWLAVYLAGGTSPVVPSSLVDVGTQTGVTPPSGVTLPLNGGLTVENDFFSTFSGSYLKTSMHVNRYTTNAAYTQTQGDRGTLLVWDTGGPQNYNLMPATAAISPSANGAGDGFIASINNSSGTAGTCTILPSGSDTIEGSAFFTLAPGLSLSLISDGVSNWTTLGYGLNTLPLTFVDVTIELAAGTSTAPSLSFFGNTNLGIFECPANYIGAQAIPNWVGPSFEIVQGGIPLGDFQQNSTWANGLVTLAWNGQSQISGSTFSPAAVTINSTGTAAVNSTTSTMITSAGTITIDSTAGNVNIDGDLEITLTSPAINNETPALQQFGISIYSITLAYL